MAIDRASVLEVGQLLAKAISQEELGQHDASIATYQQVLRMDPYNVAARHGMELVEQRKAAYFGAARDQARLQSLNQVSQQWGQDVSSAFGVTNASASEPRRLVAEAGRPADLLDSTLSQLAFNGVTIEEAIEYLRVKSRDADTRGIGLNLVLVPKAQKERQTLTLSLSNITFRGALDSLAEVAGLNWSQEESVIMFGSLEDNLLITRTFKVPPDFFTTSNLTLASTAGEPAGFSIVKTSTSDLLRGMGIEMPEGASASYSRGRNTLVVRTTTAGMALLEDMLADRLGKASRQFMVEVRMIDITHEALEEMKRKNDERPSLLARAKRLIGLGHESPYTRDSMMKGGSDGSGLDWVNGLQTAGLLGSLLLGTNQMTFGSYGIALGGSGPPGGGPPAGGASGGVPTSGSSSGAAQQGNTTSVSQANQTAPASVPPSYEDGTSSAGYPLGLGSSAGNLMSTGQGRSRSMPIHSSTPNSGASGPMPNISTASSASSFVGSGSAGSALPAAGGGGFTPSGSGAAGMPSGVGAPTGGGAALGTGLASGSFSLAGLLSNPMLSQMLKAVRQRKGTDVMAAPSVLAKSGQKASINIVREFPYPTEFDPPQIPQSVGQFTVGNVTTFTDSNRGPVTPTTPTAFETRGVGFTLEVEGIVSDDCKTIELSVQPDWTEFEGFIDYGDPIYEVAPGGSRQLLTENKIPQAIFRTIRAKNITVNIYSGSTIVIAGLLDERRTIERKSGGPSGGLTGIVESGTQALPKKRAIILTVTATVKSL